MSVRWLEILLSVYPILLTIIAWQRYYVIWLENNATAQTWSQGRKSNGRGIIEAWRLYYLGTSRIEMQLIQAEEKMKKLSYTIEGK